MHNFKVLKKIIVKSDEIKYTAYISYTTAYSLCLSTYFHFLYFLWKIISLREINIDFFGVFAKNANNHYKINN